MIKVDELRGIIVKNGLTQNKLAAQLGMAPATFYRKMRKGIFGSDEMQEMINILHIDNPADIFFSNKVT